MYPVNSNFHSLSTQDAPKTRARIYFIGDSVDCTNDSDVQTNGTLLVWANGDTDSNGRIGEDGIRWDEYFNRDKNIEIGAAVSSQIEIPLINSDGALNNFSFGRCKVYLDVYDTANSAWRVCPMGVYIIDLPTKRRVKLISASGYDQMQLLDTICDSWWAGLNWSGGITLSALLTSMANQLGVKVSTATASAILNSTVSYTEAPFACVEATYREVLEYIAEATGTVARFDRDGYLDLRFFSAAQIGGNTVTINADTTGNTCLDLDIAEYQAAAIDLLKVKIAEDDIGVTVGSGTNQYTIVNNLFLYGSTATIITNRATPIYNRLNGLGAYTPLQAKLIYDWSLEAGDIINIVRGSTTYPALIFQQTLSWRGGYVTANIIADGDNVRPIMDYNERVSYRMASEMSQKVGDNEIISKINQTAESIKIQAAKVDLAGYVTFTNLSTPGQTEIDGGNIYGGTLTLGGNNNVNGTMTVKDANGNTACTVTNAGIVVNGSDTKTTLNGGAVVIGPPNDITKEITLCSDGPNGNGFLQSMYLPDSGDRSSSQAFWWQYGWASVAKLQLYGNQYTALSPSEWPIPTGGIGMRGIFYVSDVNATWITARKSVTVNGVLDVVNRRVTSTSLSSIGWHRLLKVNSIWRGSSPFQIDIFIGRERNNSNNEQHRITLLVGYDSYAFVNETSGSNTQLVQGIRYTNNGTNGFVDILYGSTAQNNVYADFTVHCNPEQQDGFIRQGLQEVDSVPSVETVLATYDFAQNVSNSKTAGFNKTEYTGNIASSGTVSFDYNPTAKITVFRADSSATPVSVLLDQWDGITYLSKNNSLATVSVSGKTVTITNAASVYVNYIAEIYN